jgi:hypothetical protein
MHIARQPFIIFAEQRFINACLRSSSAQFWCFRFVQFRIVTGFKIFLKHIVHGSGLDH